MGNQTVTFQTHRGSKTYRYSPMDYARILGGADPNDFDGTPDSGSGVVSTIEDIAEIAEVL